MAYVGCKLNAAVALGPRRRHRRCGGSTYSRAAGTGSTPTLFHLTLFTVPGPAARAARRLAAATTTTPTARVESEDGVALAADDRHEERGDERDEDEDGGDYDDRRQRLGSVLRTYHVDQA